MWRRRFAQSAARTRRRLGALRTRRCRNRTVGTEGPAVRLGQYCFLPFSFFHS
jgi:hypothetical protein